MKLSDILIKIQEELEKSENNNFNIKLGSFFGSKIFFFLEWGPAYKHKRYS